MRLSGGLEARLDLKKRKMSLFHGMGDIRRVIMHKGVFCQLSNVLIMHKQ